LIAQAALNESNVDLKTAGARAMLMLDPRASLAPAINAVFNTKPGELEKDSLSRVRVLKSLGDFGIPLSSMTADLARTLFNETEAPDGAVSFHARRLFDSWLGLAENARPEEMQAALENYFESRRALEATTPGGT
jgi:hypothetical protein